MARNNNIDIQIDEPVILININRKYRDDLTNGQLYEVTRSAWRISPDRARKAKYALSNYRGKVKEVYEIEDWEFAEMYHEHKRYRFYGKIAPNEVRNKYIDGLVASYRKRGSQNPILYVNC